jgi:hypothetical protein
MTTIVARAAESNHWYGKDGKPAYSVIGANGKERSTTLRDARKMGLIPSVTTIIKSAASPSLEAWKLNQMMLAALTLPRADDEPEEEFIARIQRDSKEHAKMAAERGTAVHTAIESMYSGIMHAEFADHQAGVYREIEKEFGITEFQPEKAFAHELGFGGKVDLFTPAYQDRGLVIDIKTKEFSDPSKVAGYDEHMMQLAAYRVGLGLPNADCANVFVSVSVPGLVICNKWSQEDLSRGWSMFQSLLSYWQAKNQHK